MTKLLAFLTLLFPTIALAADGGTAAVADAGTALPAVTVQATPTSIPDILQGLVSAFQTHNWTMVAALLLIGVVALLRWVAPKLHSSTGDWLNTKRGGSSLVLVCGVLSAVGATLYGKGQPSLQTVLSGLLVGVAASGGWNVCWDLLAPNDRPAGPVPMIHPPAETDPPKAA